jgi:hypothetical protein
MRERLGEEFGGAVTAVTSFGLFVELDGLYVEGLVHITELGGEYYRFDEVRQELRGERSRRALRGRQRACGCRSAASTSTVARSTSASSARRGHAALRCARGAAGAADDATRARSLP